MASEMGRIRGIVRRRSTRKETFAARRWALWITLTVGALIAATIKARRIFRSTDETFRSTDDRPSYTPDQAEAPQPELEETAAAH
jgi:hypothetical protein